MPRQAIPASINPRVVAFILAAASLDEGERPSDFSVGVLAGDDESAGVVGEGEVENAVEKVVDGVERVCRVNWRRERG